MLKHDGICLFKGKCISGQLEWLSTLVALLKAKPMKALFLPHYFGLQLQLQVPLTFLWFTEYVGGVPRFEKAFLHLFASYLD